MEGPLSVDVRLILVPYHLGREEVGLGRGPRRLVTAGLPRQLARHGLRVTVEAVELLPQPDGAAGSRQPYRSRASHPASGGAAGESGRAALRVDAAVAERVRAAVAEGQFPFVLAGDCNSSLGTVAGLTADGGRGGGPGEETGGSAGRDVASDLGVLWFDAHGDFNTPETSPSGFFDGMAIAALTGRCWSETGAIIGGFQPLPENRVVLAGVRALDELESVSLAGSAVGTVPAQRIAGTAAAEIDAALAGLRERVSRLYVHVDLDVLDPSEVVANAWATSGGLSLAELERILRVARERFDVRAAAVTAYDPEGDGANRALGIVTRIAATLLGTDPEPIGAAAPAAGDAP